MTRYSRISTCSASASRGRPARRLTLKATISADEAEASRTSESETAPTPDEMKRTLDFGVLDLLQRLPDRLDRPLHVALDDQVQFLGRRPP